jgi:ketopantoate reductase
MRERETIAVVGMGQLGGLLSAGLAMQGHTIVPFLRGDSVASLVDHAPRVVLVAVGERDLASVLDAIPASLRDRVVLLQNELLPPDWEREGIVDPTVLVVWAEKKAGRAPRVIRPTPIAGPHAERFVAALARVDVPAEILDDRDALTHALVVKNVYILVTNLAGLRHGIRTTGALADAHGELVRSIASEVLDVEEARLGAKVDRERVIAEAVDAMRADPEHGCAGRTAKEREERLFARRRALLG